MNLIQPRRAQSLSLITLTFFFWNFNSAFCSLATWMYLGLVSSSSHTDQLLVTAPHTLLNGQKDESTIASPVANWCDSISGLVDHQKALCRRFPDVFLQLKDAAHLAIMECQYQFHNERWNCTTTNDKRVFGKSIMKGNKETAFLTAISAAAVVHSVVTACSSGNLSSCGCDIRQQGRHLSGFRWGGCSDNVDFGVWFSRQFNDAPEEIKRKDARGIRDAMFLHNKAAGRIQVRFRSQEEIGNWTFKFKPLMQIDHSKNGRFNGIHCGFPAGDLYGENGFFVDFMAECC